MKANLVKDANICTQHASLDALCHKQCAEHRGNGGGVEEAVLLAKVYQPPAILSEARDPTSTEFKRLLAS